MIGQIGGAAFEGWTASNVLRRLSLNEAHRSQLRSLYHADLSSELAPRLATRRWRVVHALGRSSDSATRTFLLNHGVLDPSIWVRYGSVRSLMEIASNVGEYARHSILEGLSDLVLSREHLVAPRILRELRRTTLVRGDVDQRWYSDVQSLLLAVRQHSQEDTKIWNDHLEEVTRRARNGG